MIAVLSLGAVALPSAAIAEEPGTQREMAASYGEKLGLSVDEAQSRLDQQDRLIPVADQLRKQLGDAYAGIWFDPNDGGRMKVGIGAAASKSQPALVEGVNDVLAENKASADADLVRVAFTAAELEAQQDRLNTALAAEIEGGDLTTGLDFASNAVAVRIGTDVSDAVRAKVAEAVENAGVSARVTDATGKEPFLSSCVARSSDQALFCGNPFRGAVTIGTASTSCSAGFVTLGNSGGNPWLLTAGHCLYDGGGTATWSSRDAALTLHGLGTRHSYTFGAAGDYGLTGFSTAYWNTSPYVVYDGASTLNETYHIYDAGTSYQGMPICSSGGVRLGNGHYSDCGSVTGLNVTAGGIQHLGEANVCSGVPGDSGGPFYKDGHGYGLLSGGWSTCDVTYQGLAGALSGSNVHLVG